MKRRRFLKDTIASGAFVGLGGLSMSSCLGPAEKTITILHTNDVHSHIEPFEASHSKFPNLGGVAPIV